MCCAIWLANFAMVANWLPTVCQFRNGCQLVANWLPISQRLRIDCQLVANLATVAKIPAVSSAFQFMLQNLHKTSKINARKIA